MLAPWILENVSKHVGIITCREVSNHNFIEQNAPTLGGKFYSVTSCFLLSLSLCMFHPVLVGSITIPSRHEAAKTRSHPHSLNLIVRQG